MAGRLPNELVNTSATLSPVAVKLMLFTLQREGGAIMNPPPKSPVGV